MTKKRKQSQAVQDAKVADPYPTYHDLMRPDVDGAHLYSSRHELPWDLEPYWKHRHSMFSLYDKGIWTTDDSWFEVTHEPVAQKIATHVAAAKPDNRVIMIDCFAGIGGNAIAFALSGYRRVYAIEKSIAALECARHNARIYGVHDKITFFHGDCFDLLGLNEDNPSAAINELVAVIRKAGIIFASPPWGGPKYKDSEVFDLGGLPYSMDFMFSRFSSITRNVVLYLPRTSDLNQLSDHVEEGETTQIVHYCIHQNSKALCAFFGDWKEIDTSD